MLLTSRKTSSRARDVVQFVECLSWHAQNPLFNAQDYIKLGMICTPIISALRSRDRRFRTSVIFGHKEEFKARLGYMGPYSHPMEGKRQGWEDNSEMKCLQCKREDLSLES